MEHSFAEEVNWKKSLRHWPAHWPITGISSRKESKSVGVSTIGKVQGISGLILTEKGYLQVHCYSTKSNFQTYLPTFHQIITSVAISPGLAYKPRWSDNSPILSGIDWSQVAAKAIGGAIIGGL